MPIKLNSSIRAAHPVDPLPMNGSSTVPPSGVINRQSQRIRSRDLTVGCVDLFPFEVILTSVGDAALPAPGGDPIRSLVMVRHGVKGAAFSAWLPPLSVPKLASTVNSFVNQRCNQFKVFDLIVELDSIPMVDLISIRDGAVELLPNNHMLHSNALLHCVPDATMTLGGDCPVSTRSTACWTSFSHDCHSTVINSELSSPAFLSAVDGFG